MSEKIVTLNEEVINEQIKELVRGSVLQGAWHSSERSKAREAVHRFGRSSGFFCALFSAGFKSRFTTGCVSQFSHSPESWLLCR